MSHDDIVRRLERCGAVPILRMREAGPGIDVCRALVAGGIDVFEVTMGTPNALDVIRDVRAAFGDAVAVGAGTVLDPETARLAVSAGAQFVVAPNLNPELIRFCRRYSVPVLPGAFTPTEIVAAWEAGADLVKVFPVRAVGPSYLRDVLAPLPQIRLVAVGGVTLENAGDFIRAGATAVGIGGELLSPELIRAGRFTELEARARALAEAIAAARTQATA